MTEIKLLIADDEENVRNSLEKYIRNNISHISHVFVADNGQTALDLIIQHRPQIVLLDIQMPLKSGLEIMKQVQAMDIYPATIILSGHDDFEYVQAALRQGASDYLLKPCRSTKILECIETIIAKDFPDADKNVINSHSGNNFIDEAIKYINENYPSNLTLKDVANHVGISSSYLSTLFTRTLECSFVDYLNKVRIDRACGYFYDNKIKTYEIAYKVGYKDDKYFSKVFKRITGKSPSEYRRTMNKK